MSGLRFAAACAALVATLAPSAAHAATFVVTKTADTADGACDSDCSLREAVIASNTSPGADTITVPAGVYALTLTGFEDAAATGDLDVLGDLTIEGAGLSETIVDGSALGDLVFALATGGSSQSVTIRGLTIRHGVGLVEVVYEDVVLLEDVRLTGNVQVFALVVDEGATATLVRCRIDGVAPIASGPTQVVTNAGTLTIRDSAIYGNLSRSYSTLNGFGGTMTLENVTVSGNVVEGASGAVDVGIDTTALLRNVTIANNQADYGTGGLRVFGDVSVGHSLLAGNTAVAEGTNFECLTVEAFGASFLSLGHNVVGHFGPCAIVGTGGDKLGFSVESIGLLPLADNGGPVVTHGLGPTSVALGAGSAATPGSGPGACTPTDARGQMRDAPCDVGAFEAVCGNARVEGAEGCDDGGTEPGDDCDATCQSEIACGNGDVETGEECDDANLVTEACAYGVTSCVVCGADCAEVAGATAYCGDGELEGAFEDCDDGNAVTEPCPYGAASCVACDATCTEVPGALRFCGDGVHEPDEGEECDDGGATEACTADCEAVVPTDPDGGPGGGAGGGVGGGAGGGGPETPDDGGCSCRAAGGSSGGDAAVIALVLVLLVARRGARHGSSDGAGGHVSILGT